MTFVERIVGAAVLNEDVYEEVEADRTATTQAVAIVVLAAVAAGIGSGGHVGLGALIAAAMASIVSWVVWALLVWVIGTKWLREAQTQADPGELLRTLGFSAAPGMLRVLGIVPVIGGLVFGITTIWMLVTMVIAVRQALDMRSIGRAAVVCLIGWVLHLVIFTVLLRLLAVRPAY